jgi:hypothetical protein
VISAKELPRCALHALIDGALPTTIGKELEVAGRRLWIDNDKRIEISDKDLSGEVKLHVWEPTWTEVSVSLAQDAGAAGLAFPRLRSHEDVDALISLDQGATTIVKGDFPFGSISADGAVVLGDDIIGTTSLTAKSGAIIFTNKAATARLDKVKITGATSSVGSKFGVAAQTDGPVSINTISFNLLANGQALAAASSTIRKLDANLHSIALASPPIEAPKGRISIEVLSPDEISGVLNLDDADLGGVGILKGTAVPRLSVSFAGPYAHLKITGTATVTTIGIGQLQISDFGKSEVTFSRNDDGKYSVSMTVNNTGKFALGNVNTGGLSAQLDKLLLNGVLTTAAPSRIAIDPGGIAISISQASANVIVLGQQVELPAKSVSLSNDQVIVVELGKAGGVLRTDLAAVQLQSLLIDADDGAKAAPISVPVPQNADNRFSVGWDLSTGTAVLFGSIKIPGFSITVPDPPKYLLIRTRNFDVQLSSLSVQDFTIAFTGPQVQLGIDGASIGGNQLVGRSPDYAGTLSQPLMFSAKGAVPIQLPIVFNSIEIDDARIGIVNGSFASSSLGVSQATLNAHVVRATTSDANGDIAATTGTVKIDSDMGGGTVSATSLAFSFLRSNNVLNGKGSLGLGAFKLNISAEAPIGVQKCNGNTLKYHADATSLGLTGDLLVESNQIYAQFDTQPTISSVGTSYYRCDYSEHVIVAEAQKAYYSYPCPTGSEPLRTCDGWTYISPEISFDVPMVLEIQPISGFAAVMQLHGQVYQGQVRGCWVRPIIAMTSPVVVVWGPNAPGLPGVALRIAEGLIESILANSLVTTAEQFVALALGSRVPISTKCG